MSAPSRDDIGAVQRLLEPEFSSSSSYAAKEVASHRSFSQSLVEAKVEVEEVQKRLLKK